MQKHLIILFAPISLLYANPETIIVKIPLRIGETRLSVEKIKERKPRFISEKCVPTLSHNNEVYSYLMYVNEEGQRIRSDMIEYFGTVHDPITDQKVYKRLFTRFVAKYIIAERP